MERYKWNSPPAIGDKIERLVDTTSGRVKRGTIYTVKKLIGRGTVVLEEAEDTWSLSFFKPVVETSKSECYEIY
jgi:hypothetical protein